MNIIEKLISGYPTAKSPILCALFIIDFNVNSSEGNVFADVV